MTFRSIILFALLQLSLLSVEAQQVVLSPYIESCPLLTEEQKKELTGVVEGATSSDAMPSYSLRTSSLSTMDIRLYPMPNGTPLIGVLEHFSQPQRDSSIVFYTPEWKPISLKGVIDLPSRESFTSFLEGNTSPEAQRLRQLLYPLHHDIRWEEQGALSIGIACTLSEDDKQNEPLKQLIEQMPRCHYEWSGYRFVLKH